MQRAYYSTFCENVKLFFFKNGKIFGSGEERERVEKRKRFTHSFTPTAVTAENRPEKNEFR